MFFGTRCSLAVLQETAFCRYIIKLGDFFPETYVDGEVR